MAWRLIIASVSLLAAIAVYGFARSNPPEIISHLLVTNSELVSSSSLFGSAPSLFYTLALGLLIGACASSRHSARFHCFLWIGLCLLLEFTQHPVPAQMLSAWLSENLFDSAWNLVGPYWQRGVFDPFDLIATLVGGLVALVLITRVPAEETDAAS